MKKQQIGSKKLSLNLSTLLFSTALLSACGGASSSDPTEESNIDQPIVEQPTLEQPEEPTIEQPTPEQPTPEQPEDPTIEQSAIISAALAENEEVLATSRLRSSIDDLNSIITLTLPLSTPELTLLELDDGSQISTPEEIQNYFSLQTELKNNNGVFEIELEIAINKTFDYESDSKSFRLTIAAGSEEKIVHITLFDIQNGREDEPLIISNYNELVSFFSGTFSNETNSEYEIIRLADPDSTSHNTDRLYVELDRDIDASASEDNLWQARSFEGYLNGNNHVISSLRTNNGFISTTEQGHVLSIGNIGFVDAHFKHRFILSAASINSSLNSVFVSGFATTSGQYGVIASVLTAANITKVYSNVFWDLSSLRSRSSGGRHEISALLGSPATTVSIKSGYANGAMQTLTDGPLRGVFSGIAAHSIASDFNQEVLNSSQVYSAVDYRVTHNQGTEPSGRAFTEAGGLQTGALNTPNGLASADDYRWRFITDRNGNELHRGVGLIRRDTNNDGIADLTISADLTGAGVTEQEAKQESRFTGHWQASDSHFDIIDGEYPVLKGMPYPHTESAEWMNEVDPGIAYQRATFDDYLQAP